MSSFTKETSPGSKARALTLTCRATKEHSHLEVNKITSSQGFDWLGQGVMPCINTYDSMWARPFSFETNDRSHCAETSEVEIGTYANFLHA